jgi:hypothetical protein
MSESSGFEIATANSSQPLRQVMRDAAKKAALTAPRRLRSFHSGRATHHQMVQSLYPKHGNMEHHARSLKAHVNTLWRLYREENASAKGCAERLEQYYIKHFPEDRHFSRFFRERDEALQIAFQKAVAEEGSIRNRNDLKAIFRSDWTWLECWSYARDKAAEHYLRARYALISGWAKVPLDDVQNEPRLALELAMREGALCESELDRNPERPHREHLNLKVF